VFFVFVASAFAFLLLSPRIPLIPLGILEHRATLAGYPQQKVGAGIGSTGMGARWTRKGSAYITSDTKKIPYPSRLLEMQIGMLERDGSSPIEIMTSSHGPWELQNTQDGYEPQKARSHGRLGFPRTGRDIPIEAIRGERKRKPMRNALLKTIFAV